MATSLIEDRASAVAEQSVAQPAAIGRGQRSRAGLFAAAAIGVALASCLLAGWMPLGFSIVTIFLFAGPHNWMEGRYMMARMPVRWGPLRPYFLTGICGVLGLTAAFAALPAIARGADWSDESWQIGLALWNTALVAWLASLVWMRSRQNPRRDWNWVLPVALLLVAAAWVRPQAWDLGLVYLHPLVALTFLDREISVRRPEWRTAYRSCLALLPVLLGLLWWRLANSAPLPGNDGLTARITSHAGSNILAGVSSHLLVATHTFLEMLHYGVWLVAIPLVSLRTLPWNFSQVPLARRSRWWKLTLGGVLALGATIVLVLWAGFIANYPLTRDIYFTIAMLHVLAEAPFLLRLL
jgi:hypothetical protein